MSIETTTKRLFLNSKLRIAGLLLIMTSASSLQASELPLVRDTTYNGTAIVWSAVDTAIGYNIYLDGFYIDTVANVTEYVPTSRGRYQIAAFDGNGNYSPLIGTNEQGEFIFPTATVNMTNTTVGSVQNVTGIVYSNSAGELYWDRETSRTLTYTVTINGVELGSTTGNSFWIDSLLAGTENRVTVTASSGIRFESESTTIIFDTRSNDYPTAASLATSIPVADSQISTPQNPRIESYAATIAELFWDRAPASQNVVTTEIFRDNVLIGTSPGNSFYDDTRLPRTNYTYDIIAINADGKRSAPAIINPNGFDGQNEEVVLSLLAGISMIATDNPHTQFFPMLRTLANGGFRDQLTLVKTNIIGLSDGTAGTEILYRCANATDEDFALGFGQMTRTLEGGLLFTRRVKLDECEIDGELFSGSYTYGSSEDALETINYFNLDNLSQLVSMNGKVTDTTSGTNRSIVYSDFDFSMEDFDDSEFSMTQGTLNQAILYFNTDGRITNSFTTDMVISAPWTGGRRLTVETMDFFSERDQDTGNYTIGEMEVVSDNGESLFWSANTGDARSWFAELNSAESVTSLTGNWGELIKLPCIDFDDECL